MGVRSRRQAARRMVTTWVETRTTKYLAELESGFPRDNLALVG